MGRIMMERITPAENIPIPVVWAGKNSRPAQGLDEEWIQVLAQQGNQHKNRPQAINHAGNGGQQFGKEGQEATQAGGTHLGEEYSDPYRQRHGDDERQDRRDHGTVDKRQRAEVAVDRIPRRPEEKRHSEFLNGELRARNELDQDQQHNGENAQRTQQHESAEGAIGKRGAAAVEKIRADGRERRLGARRRAAFCSLGHVSLASHSRHLSI